MQHILTEHSDEQTAQTQILRITFISVQTFRSHILHKVKEEGIA